MTAILDGRGEDVQRRPKCIKGPPHPRRALVRIGGAKRDRTADLYNAIVALSQLSYGPKTSPGRAAGTGTLLIRRQPRNPLRGIQGKTGPPALVPLALLVLVDLLDHLGNIVLVLAELGGVFQHLFFLFLRASQAIARQLDIGNLDLGRRGLLGHRCRTAAARRLRCFRLIDRLAFRADDRILVQVIEAGAAIGALALRSPGLLHAALPPRNCGARSASAKKSGCQLP